MIAIATSLSLNLEWVLYQFFSDANLSLSLSGNRPSDSYSDIAIAVDLWKRNIRGRSHTTIAIVKAMS